MTLDDEVSDMSGGAGWTGVSGDGGLQPAGTARPSGSCHCWARGGEDQCSKCVSTPHQSSDLRNAHLQTRRWPKPHINSRPHHQETDHLKLKLNFTNTIQYKYKYKFSSVKLRNRPLEVQNALYHTIKNYWTLEKEKLCAILLLHSPESCKKWISD